MSILSICLEHSLDVRKEPGQNKQELEEKISLIVFMIQVEKFRQMQGEWRVGEMMWIGKDPLDKLQLALCQFVYLIIQAWKNEKRGYTAG